VREINTLYKKITFPVILLLVSAILAACGDPTATTAPTTTAAPTTSVTTTTAAPTTAMATTTAAATTPATTVATTAAPTTAATRLKVVATTSQIADFAKNVGGNRVEVYTIIKPGRDAHDFEPTAEDSKALAAAQLVLANGLGLEEWLDKTIQNSGTKAVKITTSDGVALLEGKHEHEEEEKDEHKHGDYDPHIWFSTVNAKQMVDNVTRGLVQVDPSGKATYEANASTYKTQLDDLTKQIKTLLDPISADRRKLVTNHEAFTYFADQFNLKVVGTIIPSFDSTAEPSAQELTELVKNIKAEKVPAIFTENTINPKLAEQISREAGVKIYSNLYGDSLGESGSDGDTYIKMMLTNARNIANGLK
jgi:ABC-type Zn uptake system ZnuABC Zn-binding protein ZnuA